MKEIKPYLIIIAGPTAVGKTSISIEIAKQLNGEIVSADSMQIYKYMDIGTAKISKNEMQGIQHYLIDEINPEENFTVSDFQLKAKNYINGILNKNKLPIVVGGTGLYINSLIYDLDFSQAISNWKLRENLLNKAKQYGNEWIYGELKRIDIDSANRIHINDTKRIIRALEIYYETGKPMSHFYKDFRKENNEYNIIFIGLTMDRKILYERINNRIDLMIKKGLIDEVNKLLHMGYSENLVSMQGLGYKEIIAFLKGESSLAEAVEILKRDSRRYAKRQLTWLRREEKIKWIAVDKFHDNGELIEHIINYIKEKIN